MDTKKIEALLEGVEKKADIMALINAESGKDIQKYKERAETAETGIMYEAADKKSEIILGIKTAIVLMNLMQETVIDNIPRTDDEQRDWKLEVFCIRQDLFKALFDCVVEKLRQVCELCETRGE